MIETEESRIYSKNYRILKREDRNTKLIISHEEIEK